MMVNDLDSVVEKGLLIGCDTPYYKIDVKSKYHKMLDVKDKETIYPVLPVI